MSKAQNNKRLSTERVLVAAIKNKMDALANAQFFKNRHTSSKNRNHSEYQKLSSAEKKFVRNIKVQQIKTEIHLLLYANGFRPHVRDPQIARATTEESLAIRFDFDGIIHRPDRTLLSAPYVSAKQTYQETLNNSDIAVPPEFSLGDYQLDASPIWQKLKLFDNFRQTRKKIIRSLIQNHIPPTAVKTMNYYDFVDALADNSKRTNTRPFEGSRSKNLKMFAHCYGEEFTEIMLSLHYKPDAVRQMLKQMQNGKSPNILDLHHKTNVADFREMEHPERINTFPNMLLTFIHPHHRSLHFDKGYDIDKNIVFFGGYDPAYQIRRSPEKERQYLISKGRLPKDAKSR